MYKKILKVSMLVAFTSASHAALLPFKVQDCKARCKQYDAWKNDPEAQAFMNLCQANCRGIVFPAAQPVNQPVAQVPPLPGGPVVAPPPPPMGFGPIPGSSNPANPDMGHPLPPSTASAPLPPPIMGFGPIPGSSNPADPHMEHLLPPPPPSSSNSSSSSSLSSSSDSSSSSGSTLSDSLEPMRRSGADGLRSSRDNLRRASDGILEPSSQMPDDASSSAPPPPPPPPSGARKTGHGKTVTDMLNEGGHSGLVGVRRANRNEPNTNASSSAPVASSSNPGDSRSDLLANIRQGSNLRKVDMEQVRRAREEADKQKDPMLAALAKRADAMIGQDNDSSDSEADTEGWKSE